MTLQQLHYMITIAETGSLNKAAEVLYVAQSTLSGTIRELEKELDITIFNRNSRGVTLTSDGMEFLSYARELYAHYKMVRDKYGSVGRRKQKFNVSTQHYSFAVQSFIEMVKQFNTMEYEFSIRETRTLEVIEDVGTEKSEIGVLYLSDFNRSVIQKYLRANDLEFHRLIECRAYVYLWKGHPLAGQEAIRLEELESYPCLSFEQGGNGSFYFAEEILSTNEYPRVIKANDRATMLNLMVGLNGYTLCSGIICQELNGSDYMAVPFQHGEEGPADRMEIGYIVKRNRLLSRMGELYIHELEDYLKNEALPYE